jgi:hypothetical protein
LQFYVDTINPEQKVKIQNISCYVKLVNARMTLSFSKLTYTLFEAEKLNS